MAVFTSSFIALRKKLILEGLMKNRAFSPETAMTLAEAGVENPDYMPEYTGKLVFYGILGKTKDGKYWIRK